MRQELFIFILYLLFCYSFNLIGQEVVNDVTFNKLPIENQLVSRDENDDNFGTVRFQGIVHYNLTPFEKIKIEVFREEELFNTNTILLKYNNNQAGFLFDLKIFSELATYSFIVKGLKDGVDEVVITEVGNIVAGDVYIIQGQSNAEARKYEGSANDNVDDNLKDFIRVYASGTKEEEVLYSDDNWYVAQGDGSSGTRGNTGQWGLQLSRMLIDSMRIPIAIFNGAKGGQNISYYQENNRNRESGLTNNYERLYYRLAKTGLKEAVKAVFWAHGDNTGFYDNYEDIFLNIKESWLKDYSNIKKIYIFQTRNGCNTNGERKEMVKEAQRKLAASNEIISIMSTDGLNQFYDGNGIDFCHYKFKGGYDNFAKRIFPVVKRDIYGEVGDFDIEPPNILGAYLQDETTLIVETNADSLSIDKNMENNFKIHSSIDINILNIEVSGSNIIFELSQYPGNNALISNLGNDPGESDKFIFNSSNLGIEMVNFYKYNIDASKFTVWDGTKWLYGNPEDKDFTTIKGDYNAIDGGFSAKNLTLPEGINLKFDNYTTNSIVVNGDLNIQGNFVVGDTESLLIKNANALVSVSGTGSFTKKEKTKYLNNEYDATFWSSPVQYAEFSSIFTDVESNYIYYYNPKDKNNTYLDSDYIHWFNVDFPRMEVGRGYSVNGKTNVSYPNSGVEFEFKGVPNYGDIDVEIGSSSNNDIDKSNLIGNPYPSAIRADDLINNNVDKFDGSLYLWSHKTNYTSGEYEQSDYQTYNYMGLNESNINQPYYIASGQGFMILTDENSAIFSFKKSMQVGGENNQFFKEDRTIKNDDENLNRIWLNLFRGSEKCNEILVGFTKNATDNVDFGYDAISISISENKLYSVINKKKYAIQSVSDFTENKSVELGVDLAKSGDFSIGISRLEGRLKNKKIYLIDKILNVIHDLKKEDYKFYQSDLGEFLNRFQLKFNSSATLGNDEYLLENDIIITNTDDGFKIKSVRNVERLRIIDMLGRNIYNSKPQKQNFIISFNMVNKGSILILEFKLDNGSIIKKRSIRY